MPLLLLALSTGAFAQSKPSSTVTPELLSAMRWREIGPFRGGRSNAASGVVGRPKEFYMGTTGGGIWKSMDAGETWRNVSDGFMETGSVGSIAVSESNPDVVIAGMGEHALRGNITHGDGIYRSDDAGATWRSLGLRETRQIGRVRIHPKNPDVIWVAALGETYNPSADRGIYKTTDGGKTWRKTLFVSDRAGALEISLNPKNPEELIASTWEAWRTPYSLNSGGPGSRIFRSRDGGDTWIDLTDRPGLPAGVKGKIGVSISPVNPKIVYAMVENALGGLYRSDDSGDTWRLVNGTSAIRQRPWYYSRVIADPKDVETVYVLNVAAHKSTDGGKTFRSFVAQHSDHHDLWIDPADNTRMAAANDGGVSVTVDGGRKWSDQDYPTAQFYHVSTDNAFPYRVLGAQQDNSTVRIPSRTFGAGITKTDWTSTAGGESGYVTPHPKDPDLVFGGSYGGELEMLNHRTNLSRGINIWPEDPLGSGAADLVHRVQWTFPIVFSPHDSNVLYTTSQFVMRSRNNGGSWEKISPDLTRNDKSTQESSGGPITKDNTSVEYYGTVFTVAESPKRRGMIWAGSDDGLIHLTQDAGRTWRNVTPPAMPKWGLVSMIEASPHSAGTAYAAVDNHENGDHRPYVYITTNGGRTWQNLTKGLPQDVFVRVVREDPVVRGLLYAGLENGIWFSPDGGQNWQPIPGKLPKVPIHDLTIKDGDLVVATHGRSFWILDDLSPLRQAIGRDALQPILFTPPPGLPVRFGGSGTEGANPTSGLRVTYYLPKAAKSVKLELRDAKGTVVATDEPGEGSRGPGARTALMNPRYPGGRGFTGMLLWGGMPSTLKAPPGEYEVVLTVDGQTLKSKATWATDPRSPATHAELVEQWKLSTKIAVAVNEANRAVERIRDLKKSLADRPGAKGLIDRLSHVEDAIYQGKAGSTQDLLNYPIRLNNKLAGLLGHVQGSAFGPTRQSYDVFQYLNDKLQFELARLRELEKEVGDLK